MYSLLKCFDFNRYQQRNIKKDLMWCVTWCGCSSGYLNTRALTERCWSVVCADGSPMVQLQEQLQNLTIIEWSRSNKRKRLRRHSRAVLYSDRRAIYHIKSALSPAWSEILLASWSNWETGHTCHHRSGSLDWDVYCSFGSIYSSTLTRAAPVSLPIKHSSHQCDEHKWVVNLRKEPKLQYIYQSIYCFFYIV